MAHNGVRERRREEERASERARKKTVKTLTDEEKTHNNNNNGYNTETYFAQHSKKPTSTNEHRVGRD